MGLRDTPGVMLEIPRRFRRSVTCLRAVGSGVRSSLIQYMCRQVGFGGPPGTDSLMCYCGVKFTRLFVNERKPIKRYVGVDVYER